MGGATAFFVDYGAAEGSYVVDADGNRMLDMFMQIASLPLGYNHPGLQEAFKDPLMATFGHSRAALGLMPPKELPQWLKDEREYFQSSLLRISGKAARRARPRRYRVY